MVIDTNLIPVVFKASNVKFLKYECVLDWLLFGKGKLIIGGTKYKSEVVANIKSFIPFMKELSYYQKIHIINDQLVDEREKEIIRIEDNNDFDDPHIIALLSVSKGTILCSEDERSFKFVTNKNFYDENMEVPKIVCFLKHSSSSDVLSDRNICTNGLHNKINLNVANHIKQMVKSN